MELDREGAVFVLRLTDGENRFNPDSMAAWNEALDEVTAREGPAALVTTGAGKFYSNGLDLDRLTAEGPDQLIAFVPDLLKLIARMVSLPMYTVAALNGHAFAGGAMVALAHDTRTMREDRGYWCIPEIDLGMTFAPGMNALLTTRLPDAVARRAMLTGFRFGGPDAVAAEIVEAAVPEDEVVSAAVERAEANAGKDRRVMGAIKRSMYREIIELCESGAMS